MQIFLSLRINPFSTRAVRFFGWIDATIFIFTFDISSESTSFVNKLSPLLFTCPRILYIYYEIFIKTVKKSITFVKSFQEISLRIELSSCCCFSSREKGKKKRIDLILKILIFKFFQLKIQFIIFLIYSRITIYIIYFSGCPVSGCHLYFCPICRKDELPLLPLSLQKKPEERNHLFRWKG